MTVADSTGVAAPIWYTHLSDAPVGSASLVMNGALYDRVGNSSSNNSSLGINFRSLD